LFEKVENDLRQSIIKDDGSLQYKNWGISEIKIGAGFLQKKDQIEIGSTLEKLDFIKVINIRDVLIIDKDAKSETSVNGIWIKKELKEDMNFDYDFVVIKNIEKEKFNQVKDKLPDSVFVCENGLNEKDKNRFVILKNEDFNNFKEKYKEAYSKKKSNNYIREYIKEFLSEKIQEANNNFLIGYEFSIPKPRYVLIIDEKAVSDKSEKNGIYIKKDIDDNMSFDYDFVVIKAIENGKLEKIKDKLPARVFVCEEDNDNEFIKIEGCGNITREGLYKLWINKLLKDKKLNDKGTSDEEKKDKTICLEVSPHENYSGGSSVSDVKAYKYAIESLLQSYKDKDQKLVDFLNDNNPDIAELFKNLINNNKKLIPELISKKSTVVNFFKKYEEDIETLPDMFKESSEENPEGQMDNNDENDRKFQLSKEYVFNVNKTNDNNGDDTSPLYIKYKRHASAKTEGEYYVEALSGSQSYFTEIENFVKNGGEANVFAYSLLETGLLGITVVDERVFEFYNSNPEIGKRFKSVNIFVTSNLNDINKNDNKKKMEYEVDKDILIIHQGILDKNKDFSMDSVSNDFKYIFITSGSGDKKKNSGQEGKTDPFQAKFIPFSNVRSALMRQYPEKYILIQSLMKISFYHGKVYLYL